MRLCPHTPGLLPNITAKMADEWLLDPEVLQAHQKQAINELRDQLIMWQAVAESERVRRLAYEAVLTKKQREQLGVKYDDENES